MVSKKKKKTLSVVENLILGNVILYDSHEIYPSSLAIDVS